MRTIKTYFKGAPFYIASRNVAFCPLATMASAQKVTPHRRVIANLRWERPTNNPIANWHLEINVALDARNRLVGHL